MASFRAFMSNRLRPLSSMGRYRVAGDKNDKWCEYAISAGRKGRGRR
jgi:hypothetical protein